MEIIKKALNEGRMTLSEHESKVVLASYRIPVTREIIVENRKDVIKAARKIGYPVAMKGCSSEISHKTERGLIQLNIRDDIEALDSFNDILANMDSDGETVLVQEMVTGKRELVIGLIRDLQFGPCVMFGLGGVFAEVLNDVVFRIAPLNKKDALEMMDEISACKMLGSIRGMEPVDRDILSEMLINVGKLGIDNDDIKEIDINPVVISGSLPIAVDALILLQNSTSKSL